MNERKETLSNNDRGQRFVWYRSQYSDKAREDVDALSQLSSSETQKRKVQSEMVRA